MQWTKQINSILGMEILQRIENLYLKVVDFSNGWKSLEMVEKSTLYNLKVSLNRFTNHFHRKRNMKILDEGFCVWGWMWERVTMMRIESDERMNKKYDEEICFLFI